MQGHELIENVSATVTPGTGEQTVKRDYRYIFCLLFYSFWKQWLDSNI